MSLQISLSQCIQRVKSLRMYSALYLFFARNRFYDDARLYQRGWYDGVLAMKRQRTLFKVTDTALVRSDEAEAFLHYMSYLIKEPSEDSRRKIVKDLAETVGRLQANSRIDKLLTCLADAKRLDTVTTRGLIHDIEEILLASKEVT